MHADSWSINFDVVLNSASLSSLELVHDNIMNLYKQIKVLQRKFVDI